MEIDRHWNPFSNDSPDTQRFRLVRKFLNLPRIPRVWYLEDRIREPTANEINLILRPYRSDNVRKVAWAIWRERHSFPVLLRTHYNPDMPVHNAMMNNWINVGQYISQLAPWAVINDPDFFGIPESDNTRAPSVDWRRVSFKLPEAAGPEAILTDGDDTVRWRDLPPWYRYKRGLFKAQLAFEKKCKPYEWLADPKQMIEMCAAGVQFGVCAMVLIVVDKDAFDTGCPLLMYVDHFQQPIRSTRFVLNEKSLNAIVLDWSRGLLTPWMWEESEVGDNYKADGEVGKVLYQLNQTDMTLPGTLR
ncbi:hypothetical protein N7520_003442 [Penicillium odoratum]|uniref:uncharacterized protein n=1 Tax=Penicillium odoratum TaxID=1167516 RepID=UPI0025476615|nr:uncharacterized protein N7520_003442 [Penicillium odoratum]KAJ5768883.1 hypothetical protein N7520_003442 [Penicillium odoratum]